MALLTAAELARLERFAEVEGALADIEEDRAAKLASIHAEADAKGAPLRAEQAKLAKQLEDWFAKRRTALLPKGRKSVVLGGCELGSRSARTTLSIDGEESDVIDAMRVLRWAKPFLQPKVTIRRADVLKALDGKHGPALTELGFAKAGGSETFFVHRAVQEGLPK